MFTVCDVTCLQCPPLLRVAEVISCLTDPRRYVLAVFHPASHLPGPDITPERGDEITPRIMYCAQDNRVYCLNLLRAEELWLA